ncbi:hypothetical protein [uncultured Phascolarctobacterium sp.]|uniref:hypothetical protein n=1 Tax=uncultured Phascolarctobacterium sp. TaxID=512296 RepID=UPI002632A331|nr:hypothetical protein [uncultured Phascolarctobacterium sp.]
MTKQNDRPAQQKLRGRSFFVLLVKNLFTWYNNKDNRVAGWRCRNSVGMEVMLMKNYDFKDLMAFGVFILALLTFIFQFSK